MRLLVTRPEPDAERTATALRGLGHEVLVQPLLIVALEAAPATIADPAAILLTSQNALRALAEWPAMDEWLDVPVYAAGPATARAAAAAGFRDVRNGDGDAASLAGAIAAGMTPEAGTLLYPAARDRTGNLDRRLAEHGFRVSVVEAYRAEVAPRLDEAVRSALLRGELDGVLLYSRRTALAFRELAIAAGLKARLAQPTYYVLAAPVAEALAGYGRIFRVASRPDEDALLGLIPAAG